MNGSAVMSKRESILQPQFVQADYFLCRIRDFEAKYQKTWGQFYAEWFSLEKRDTGNPELIEWAFLCRTFLPELIEQEAEPPGGSSNLSQEPESNSGFSIIREGLCISIQKNISNASTARCTHLATR